MIEPSGQATADPLVDKLTRRMTAAWRNRRDSKYVYCGFHICSCVELHKRQLGPLVGEGDGKLTNSLVIHHPAHHRADISAAEVEKAERLPYGQEEPTANEPSPGRLVSYAKTRPIVLD
jgi:hypothetical protein